MNKYYEANKEKFKARQKEWYEKHKDEIRKKREEKSEELREKRREWYINNREKVIESVKKSKKNKKTTQKHMYLSPPADWTLEYKLQIFKDVGWKIENNNIVNHRGQDIKDTNCRMRYQNYDLSVSKIKLVYFLKYGTAPTVKFSIKADIDSIIKTASIKEKRRYTTNDEIVYEIKISKNKGQLTERAKMIFYQLADSLINKFTYPNEDMKYDCKMEAYLHLLNNWKGYNEEFNAFAYYSEICKRAIVKGYNLMCWYNKREIPKLVYNLNL